MHRLVLRAESGQSIDHANGDGLDNRRSNLRFATISQNAANAGPRKPGKFKGVFSRLKKHRLKDGTETAYRYYFALIIKDRKRYELKWSKDPEVCARAYDAKARELFGEFAKVNFP